MMDARTYPNKEVQAWLETVVAYRIDADDAKRMDELRSFGVKALPTLVLRDPTGKTLYNDSGGVEGTQLMLHLAYEPYKRMFELYNAQKYEEAAVPIAFLRHYFKNAGEPGKKAEELFANLKDNKAFLAAYEKALAAELAKVKEIREKAEKERRERRIKEAEELLAEANKLRMRMKRTEAIATYRKIVEEYADTPSAEPARKKLGKLGVKLESPE